jgi:hypothetical protein
MTDRPILKLTDPSKGKRVKGHSGIGPLKPAGYPSKDGQTKRLTDLLDPLVRAFEGDRPTITLKSDPSGVAPERALVFEAATSIQDFAKAARAAELEVFSEYDSDDAASLGEDDFQPPEGQAALYPTLYATMPSEHTLRRLLTHWRRYQRGETPSRSEGLMPWWHMFEHLIDLRPWGPEDRFTKGAQSVIADRLPTDDEEETKLEIEVWPSRFSNKRNAWRTEIKQVVDQLGGRIVDEQLIVERDFIYDALLITLRAGYVRALIDNPFLEGGLASIDGIQFILPQTVAQSVPITPEEHSSRYAPEDGFDEGAPMRAVLMDGVPIAAHPALDGGVVIEDVHDLERLSQVSQRGHGTAMASLILRGDLGADGEPFVDSRLLSIPILVDGADGQSSATSPSDRLFVDVIHTALVRCFTADEPLAPDAFVVNLSIGVHEQRFAGRISALARLLDWWSWKHGILFSVSAGNVLDDLTIHGVTSTQFEDATPEDRQEMLRAASMDKAFERSLLAPSEAINALTVGATSHDLSPKAVPKDPSLVRFEIDHEEALPQLSSAIGLGPAKALKPDILVAGGALEMRVIPSGDDIRLRVSKAERTGLVVATPAMQTGENTGRARGTSDATALATRSLIQAAEALTDYDGPFEGLELARHELALATRALAINSSVWPDDFRPFEQDAKTRLKKEKSSTPVKDQVAKYFGFGVLEPMRMVDGPYNGATSIGLGTIRKDQSRVFKVALPPSLAGEKLPRSMRVTVTWFSPVAPTRALYRCAAMEASCVDANDHSEVLKDWQVSLKGFGPDRNMAGRGSVWSQRLVQKNQTTPVYEDGDGIHIRVQCREVGKGGLSPDDDIAFAVAVSFEVEGEVQFDVYDEIRQQVRVRPRA